MILLVTCICQNSSQSSWFKQWNLFQEDIMITSFSNQNRDFASFFDMENKFFHKLLHNKNKYPSIPNAHSVHLKEPYDNMKLHLETIKYEYHWSQCGDLKVIGLLIGMQVSFTKFYCFFVSDIVLLNSSTTSRNTWGLEALFSWRTQHQGESSGGHE